MAAPSTTGPSAAALLKEREKVEQAVAVIDKDPGEALAALEPTLKASPGVGEITPQDMFNLMSQMQAQMAGMQNQILSLMGQDRQSAKPAHDTAAELARDKLQRDLTMQSWQDEPREPVWVVPDADEEKIFAVTGAYPPRIFRVNGLEFPITPGAMASVPSSIARQVEHSQKRRPLTNAPQGLPLIPDPQRSQFLAASQSITIGNPGHSGEGRLQPDSLPLNPPALGVRYDANGQ